MKIQFFDIISFVGELTTILLIQCMLVWIMYIDPMNNLLEKGGFIFLVIMVAILLDLQIMIAWEYISFFIKKRRETPD